MMSTWCVLFTQVRFQNKRQQSFHLREIFEIDIICGQQKNVSLKQKQISNGFLYGIIKSIV